MEDGRHRIHRDKCTGCGRCAAECFSTALVLKGKRISADELLGTILSDRAYFEESGGGVTFSGGEPVLQSEFAAELLAACKKHGLHTALQTAGNYPYERLEFLLPHLDLIMYDIKGYSPEIYQWFVKGDRERVFENLWRLNEEFPGALAVRTPCVGGVNDTEAEIENIARMVGGLKNIRYYQIIPYHGLAKVKYDALDETFANQCTTPPPEKIRALEDLASKYVTVFNQDRGFIKVTINVSNN
jgi:pyruvate formate lyase activating enzyme